MPVRTAMILAAGHGVRLRPLTDEIPKPLVPVGDRPLAAHITAQLRRAGFTRVVLNTHHKADEFRKYIHALELEVELIYEPDLLGTAGGVAGARSLLGQGPVLVWNGDIVARAPVDALLHAAEDSGVALAVLPRKPGEGTVGLDARARVVRLRGETFGDESEGGDYMGVVALGDRELAVLPPRGCLVADFFLPRLRGGGRIVAVREETPFTDVGSLGGYLAANLAWLREQTRPSGSFVHPSAEVHEGVVLRDSVIGAGAVVTGRGVLDHSVVWPGASARAPLVGAVVTTGGRVVRIEGEGNPEKSS